MKYSEAEKKVKALDFGKILVADARRGITSMAKINAQLGKNNHFLPYTLRNSPRVGLLVALSHNLNKNYLEPFLPLLPAVVASTQKELQLQAEIDRLTAENTQLKATLEEFKGFLRGR